MMWIRHAPRRCLAAVALAGLLAAPAGADEPKNAGGGSTTGTMTYLGTPLPKAFARCERNLAFTVGDGWTSPAFVVDAGLARYAGPVTMTGDGGSDGTLNCESYSSGAGVLTLAVRGHNELTGSTLDCRDDYGDPTRSRSLHGRYIRSMSEATVILSGRCLVDGVETGPIAFIVELHAVPSDLAGGEGVTRSARSLSVHASFAVAAA